jgi:hypothetical protein
LTVERALRRLWPLIAVGGLLVAAVLAAALATPSISTAPPLSLAHPEQSPFELQPPPGAPELPSTNPSAAPSAAVAPLPGVLDTIAKVLCALLAVATVVVLIFFYLRGSLRNRRTPLAASNNPAGAQNRREEVIAAVDAGLSDLDDDDRDPRRAVIACWVRLEQAAAAAGTPREPGDTPTDLVVRLLAAHQVSAQMLYPLADVYRLARYATHTVDATMRTRARAALQQLRAELMVSRSGPLEQVP